jgi:hypothetical protein
MLDSDGTSFFLLYPRKVVLSDTGNRAYEDVRALVSSQKKKSTTKRSVKRGGVCSGANPR